MVVKHNESIYFDRILYKQNVAGSIAFAQSNAKADILTLEEFEKLEQSLRENSMAGVPERGLVLETLQWDAMFMQHISRWIEDLIIYSAAEFGLYPVHLSSAKTKAALDPFMLATDIADYLVRKRVSFRETHHISGRYVAKSKETSIPMNELSFEQLRATDSRFEEDIAEAYVYQTTVERRSAKGGTSKSSVLEQINKFRLLRQR
ncbi:argininosuccinate lyase [Trichoderma asperellum]